jgi:ribonucleoside-diphosphate reductase beta chain
MDTVQEEILTEVNNRFVLYPIKYDSIFKMYKTAVSAFWQVEEVDLSKDIDDWENKLTNNERTFIEQVLSFFAASDGIVDENLVTRFYNDVKIPEARAFYTFQMAMESVHCVSADTMILTNTGYHKIGDIVNHDIRVWNGEEFSDTTVKYTGDSELIKVRLSNGMELDCTPEHKWFVRTGNQKHPERCKDTIKYTKDLIVGDVISRYELPLIDKIDPDFFQNPYMHGIFCGDGTICNGYPVIDLYNEKKSLINHIPVTDYRVQGNKLTFYATKYINKPKFFVPINYSVSTKIKWLEGIADTDGTVNHNRSKTATSVQISSTNFKFLKDIQLMLTTLGIHTNVRLNHEEEQRLMPSHNETNEYKYYNCKACYIIYITCANVKKLVQMGFNPKRLKIIMVNDIKPQPTLIKIENIEQMQGIHPTFCFCEPKRHAGIFNGILTGQSEMYSLMLNTFVKEETKRVKLFDGMHTIAGIKKKADWSMRWIESHEASFATRLVAFAVVEGIFFSSAFASIYWLKERGVMPGLTASNELIARDEGMHTEFAVLLYSMLSQKMTEDQVHELIREAVDIEIEFITESIPCSMLGMNMILMSDYVRFVADRLIVSLGYKKIYNVENPLPFMDRITLDQKSNFFEHRSLEYRKAKVGETDVYKFALDEEF